MQAEIWFKIIKISGIIRSLERNKYNYIGFPAFKSQRYRAVYQSNKKFLHQYQHAKNQLSSWIKRTHLPKNHWGYFRLSWICSIMPKILLFILFILEIYPVLESSNQIDQNLVSTGEKSGYFIDLFWRFRLLKNSEIWLTESILTHIPGTRFLPNIYHAQKHSK